MLSGLSNAHDMSLTKRSRVCCVKFFVIRRSKLCESFVCRYTYRKKWCVRVRCGAWAYDSETRALCILTWKIPWLSDTIQSLMQIVVDSWLQLPPPWEIFHTTLSDVILVVQASALNQGYVIVIKRRRRIGNKKDEAIKELDLVCFQWNKLVVHQALLQCNTSSCSTDCQFKPKINSRVVGEEEREAQLVWELQV